ncbi:predicted protein [Lodderomyces elongisporus NRRL YB-4239]|uniref:Uncharacterized protein n=1 Tax=Lodderomyces elongisporus (strain ATCC 11503 / CBS 2605 / JCM 1781 / NBRC 1676 / NRRL YB-4239) TaxID=379508 RepID=A5E1M6_LODEL|nr:predicted protein [Lodderomyces elongisporus NRRL YB-4239]
MIQETICLSLSLYFLSIFSPSPIHFEYSQGNASDGKPLLLLQIMVTSTTRHLVNCFSDCSYSIISFFPEFKILTIFIIIKNVINYYFALLFTKGKSRLWLYIIVYMFSCLNFLPKFFKCFFTEAKGCLYILDQRGTRTVSLMTTQFNIFLFFYLS